MNDIPLLLIAAALGALGGALFAPVLLQLALALAGL